MNDLPLTAAAAWGDVSQPEAASNLPEYTVSELSLALKRAIEDGFGFVRVRGEVSGLETARLRALLFRAEGQRRGASTRCAGA